MANSTDLVGLLLTNTIGMSILCETIKTAGYMFIHSGVVSKRSHSSKTMMNESKDCFAFIQGTGLELLMEDYGIGYDADNLRITFYNEFHLRKYL